MKKYVDTINIQYAEQKERELRHDVMSHIHAFGEQVPVARGIIHLGATSCFVTDNCELIQMRESLKLVKVGLLQVVAHLAAMADKHKALPTLGFTHFQPAQLTTVGKRASLWLQDFMMDLERVEHEIDAMPFRSTKGTTGTQASFLELFNGDHEKVEIWECAALRTSERASE